MSGNVGTVGSYNPFQIAGQAVDLARGVTGLRTQQFELQQAKQAQAYSMLMPLLGMQNPSWNDINGALGASARLGADPSGVIQNATDAMGSGMTPRDFVRQYSQMALPPGAQWEAAYSQGGLPANQLWQMQPYWTGDRYIQIPTWMRLGVPAPGAGYQGYGYGQGPPPGAQSGAGGQIVRPLPGQQAAAPGTLQPLIAQASQDTGVPEPVLTAMFAQESSLGRQSPNIGQITAGTAAKPGFGMEPISPEDINDPAKNIAWSARYLAARGKDLGVTNWNSPYQVAAALQAYNGGGDPNYVEHVFGRMGGGGQSSYQVASAGPGVPTPGGTQQGGPIFPLIGQMPAPGYEQTVQQATGRAGQLQSQMQSAIQTRPMLAGMEDELDQMVASGVGSRVNSTLRQALVNMGLANQTGQIASNQAAQEQFNKFAQIIAGQSLQALGNASDDRQTLAQESNPGLELSYLGNKGILHMLQGNQQATQVMGQAWQQAVNQGTPPGSFDAWRNQFTAPNQQGGRFDQRVFWLANMSPDEQTTYMQHMQRPAERQQLRRNMDYAESQGWITAGQGGGITSPF